jgi:predicted nucleotidyltransferase
LPRKSAKDTKPEPLIKPVSGHSIAGDAELGEMKRQSDTIQKKIDAMARRIVRLFHPDRIILFGSHARGTATADSDVDLLVVMPVEQGKLAKELEIRRALRSIRVPKDIIVTTPEDFAWRKDVVGTVEYPAIHEGRVVYARSG